MSIFLCLLLMIRPPGLIGVFCPLLSISSAVLGRHLTVLHLMRTVRCLQALDDLLPCLSSADLCPPAGPMSVGPVLPAVSSPSDQCFPEDAGGDSRRPLPPGGATTPPAVLQQPAAPAGG